VRHLEEETWLERLEIEIRNVSSKPVYFLEVDLSLPDVVITELDGMPRGLVIPLTYGRGDLMRKGDLATTDDVPIRTGESYVFKIPPKYREIQDRLAVVKRVGIRVYSLSFGDGTGYKAGVAFVSTNK